MPLPCLPCYSSPRIIHRARSSSYPGVSCLSPRISSYCTRSSSHLGVACVHPRIPTSRSATMMFPSILLCGSIAPFPNLCFPLDFRQSCPMLLICPLLEPLCVTPASYPLVDFLLCAHFKNWPQGHPLCHSSLFSPYVGYLRLSSRQFPHYFRPGYLPCSVCFSSFLLYP